MSTSRKTGFLVFIIAAALLFAVQTSVAAPERPVAKPSELPEDLRGVEVSKSFVPWPAQRVGFLQSRVGVVVVRHSDKGRAYFAAEGDTLFKGDVIYTLRGARCRLNIKDEDIINLAEETTFEIKSIFRDRKNKKRRSLFSMMRGKAMFYVLRLLKYTDAQADVETPTATAGIRGTQFALEIRRKSPKAARPVMLASADKYLPLGRIPIAAGIDGGVEVIGTCLDGTISLQHNTTGNVVYIPAGFTAVAGGTDVGDADGTDPTYLEQLMQDTSVGPAVTGAVSTVIAGGEGGPGEGETIIIDPSSLVDDIDQQPLDQTIPEPDFYYYGFYGGHLVEYPAAANPWLAETYLQPSWDHDNDPATPNQVAGLPVDEVHNLPGLGAGNLTINNWRLTSAQYSGGGPTAVNKGLTQTLYGLYFANVEGFPVEFMAWGHWKAGDFTINPNVGIRPFAGGWVEGARPPDSTLAALLGSSMVYDYAGFSRAYLWANAGGGWYEEILYGSFSAQLTFSSPPYGWVDNFTLNAYGPNYSVGITGGTGPLDMYGNYDFTAGTYTFYQHNGTDWQSLGAASSKHVYGALFGVDTTQNSLGGTFYMNLPGGSLWANGTYGGLHSGTSPAYPYIPVGWYNAVLLWEPVVPSPTPSWAGNFYNYVPGYGPMPQSPQAGGHYLSHNPVGSDFLWLDDPNAGPGLSGYLRAASLGTADYDIDASVTTHVYGSGAGISYGWWEVANFSIDPVVGASFYVPWGGWVELSRTTPDDIATLEAQNRKAVYSGNAHGYVFNDNTQTGSTVDGGFHAWLDFGTGMLENFDLFAYSETGQHYVAITGASGALQADGDVVITGGGGRWLVDGISAISPSLMASLAGVGGIGFGGGWSLDAGTAYSTGVFAAGVDAFYIPGDTPNLFYGTNIMLNPGPTGTTFAEFFLSDGPGYDDLGYGMLSPWNAGTGAEGFAFFNNAVGRDGAQIQDAVYSTLAGQSWIGDYRSSPVDIWSYDLGEYTYPGGGEYMDWGVYWATDPFTLTDYATGDPLNFSIPWGAGLWLNGDQTSQAELAGLHGGAVYNYAGFSRAYLYYQHPEEWRQVEEILRGQFSATIDFGAGTYGQVSNYYLALRGPQYSFSGTIAQPYDLDINGYYSSGNPISVGWELFRYSASVGEITDVDFQGNVFGLGGIGTGGTFVAIGYNVGYNVFVNGLFGGVEGGSPPQPQVGVGYYVHMMLETDGTDFTGLAGIFRNVFPLSPEATTQRFTTDTPGDFFIAKDGNNDPNSGEGAKIVDVSVGGYSNPGADAPVSGGPLGSFSTAGGHEYMDWGYGYLESGAVTLTGGGPDKLVDVPQGASYWLNGDRYTYWPGMPVVDPLTFFYSGPAYAYIFRTNAPLGTPESAQPLTGSFWSQVTIGDTSQIDMMNIFVQGSDNWVWVKDVGPIPINEQFDFNAMIPGAAISGTQYFDVYLAGSMFGPGFDGMGGWWYTDPTHENTWISGIFAGEQLGEQPALRVGYYKGILVVYNSQRDAIYKNTFSGGPIPKSVPWLCLAGVSGVSDNLNIAGPNLNPGLSGELQFVSIGGDTIENAAAALNTTVVQSYSSGGEEYMSYGKWDVEFASTWSTYGVRPQAGLWMEGFRTPLDDIFQMASVYTPLITFYSGPVEGYFFYAGEYYEEALKGSFYAGIAWGGGTATIDGFVLAARGPNIGVVYNQTTPLMLNPSGSFILDDSLGYWEIGAITAPTPLAGTGVIDGSLFGPGALGMGGEWWVQNTTAGFYAAGVFAGEQASEPLPLPLVPIGYYTGILLNNTDNVYAMTYLNAGNDILPQSADVVNHDLDGLEPSDDILDADDMSLGQGFSGNVVRGSWYDDSSGNTFDTEYTGFTPPAITTTVDGSASGSGEYMWWGRWKVGPFDMDDHEPGTVKAFEVPGYAGFWVEGHRTNMDVIMNTALYGATATYAGSNVFGYLWDTELSVGANLTGSFSVLIDYSTGTVFNFDLEAWSSPIGGNYYNAEIINASGFMDETGRFGFDYESGTWSLGRGTDPEDMYNADAVYGTVVGNTFGYIPLGVGGIWEMGTGGSDPVFHATGNFAGEVVPEPTAFYNGLLIYYSPSFMNWYIADYYFNQDPQAPGEPTHTIWQQHPLAIGKYITGTDPATGQGFANPITFAQWYDAWAMTGTYTYSGAGVPVTTTTLGSYSGSPTYLTWGDWQTDSFAMTYSATTKDFKVVRGYWLEGDRTPEIVLVTRQTQAYYSGNDVHAFYFENGNVTDTLTGSWGTWVDFGTGSIYGFNIYMTGASTYARLLNGDGTLDPTGVFSIGAGQPNLNGDVPSYWNAYGAIFGPYADAAAGLIEMSFCGSQYMLAGVFAGKEQTTQRYGYYNALLVHDDGTGTNWVTAGIYHNLDPEDADSRSHTIVYPPSTDKLVSQDTVPTAEPGFSGKMTEASNDGYTNSNVDRPIYTFSSGSYGEYLSWGWWDKGGPEAFSIAGTGYNFYVPRGFYVEGTPTQPEALAALQAANASYDYAGGASGYIWDDSIKSGAALSGDFSARLNFGPGTVTNFNVDVQDGPVLNTVNINNASGTLGTDGIFQINTGSGTWQVNGLNATERDARGFVAGEAAQSVGGIWKAGTPTLRSTGEFHGIVD